jgi:hypothetical protein
LILDTLCVHHSKLVKEWLAKEEITDKIAVFHLPSYSSEKNSDEYLNCDLKQGLSTKSSPKNASKFEENVKNHMDMLMENSDRVAKYFNRTDIKYSA